MGDEQQYDETQTGDAKIRDLGRKFFITLFQQGTIHILSQKLRGFEITILI